MTRSTSRKKSSNADSEMKDTEAVESEVRQESGCVLRDKEDALNVDECEEAADKKSKRVSREPKLAKLKDKKIKPKPKDKSKSKGKKKNEFLEECKEQAEILKDEKASVEKMSKKEEREEIIAMRKKLTPKSDLEKD